CIVTISSPRLYTTYPLDCFSFPSLPSFFFFFFTAPSTTDIYTLSLHDALPICHLDFLTGKRGALFEDVVRDRAVQVSAESPLQRDRKSTRLNSSHVSISYAVFCLKKKKKKKIKTT